MVLQNSIFNRTHTSPDLGIDCYAFDDSASYKSEFNNQAVIVQSYNELDSLINILDKQMEFTIKSTVLKLLNRLA